MAMKIIHSYSEKIVGTVNYIRADIMVDTAAELPAADSIPNIHLTMGSIAWVIGEGAFYGLKGNTWINQSNGGAVPVLTTKTITENGTYNASDDNADGYSSVTVEVPSGSEAFDFAITLSTEITPGEEQASVTLTSDKTYSEIVAASSDHILNPTVTLVTTYEGQTSTTILPYSSVLFATESSMVIIGYDSDVGLIGITWIGGATTGTLSISQYQYAEITQ